MCKEDTHEMNLNMIDSFFIIIVGIEGLVVRSRLITLVHVICVRLCHVTIVACLWVVWVVSIVHIRGRLIHVVWVAWLLVLPSVILWRISSITSIRLVASVVWVGGLNWLSWRWGIDHGPECSKKLSLID